MPFDALAMAAVADEVRQATVGGRAQRIIQPSALSLGLNIYQHGASHWLLLSADSQRGRVQLVTGKLAKAFPQPSPFVMLLRKYLENARVVSVEQMSLERVLVLNFRTAGELRLIAEIMGKHSNLMLVDDNDRILGALKLVGPRQSRVRPIRPGQPYQPPPRQDRDPALFPPGPRIDPAGEPDDFRRLLAAAPGDVELAAAMAGLLPGASPFLLQQIAWLAGFAPDAPLRETDPMEVTAAAGHLYALYQTRDWRPCTFVNQRGRRDFAPYTPVRVSEVETALSMSEAIERVVETTETRDALAVSRNALLGRIGRQLGAVDRRIASLEQGLQAAQSADRVMQQGQLVLAYQHQVEPGARLLRIPELGEEIPLEPRFSASENAERLFRRYRKLRDARNRIPPLIAGAEQERERLHDMRAFAGLAQTEADLRALERDLVGERPSGQPRSNAKKSRGPLRFTLDGFTALVGRNARENEELTFRLARRDDVWLHARERTGAHVLLQGGNPTEASLRNAARLAAFYSEARSDTATDVDITPVRNVRKVSGGPPGRVTYREFRTVRVEPSADGWEPVNGR